MKKMILCALLASSAFLSSSVFAQEETPEMQCQSMGYLAEIVMSVRQGGGSLEDLTEIINRPQHAEIKEVAEVITKGAYKFPVLEKEEDKKEMVREFGALTYVACMEGIS